MEFQKKLKKNVLPFVLTSLLVFTPTIASARTNIVNALTCVDVTGYTLGDKNQNDEYPNLSTKYDLKKVKEVINGFRIVATSHEIRNTMGLTEGDTVNISCPNEKSFIAIICDKKNKNIKGLSLDLLYPAGTKRSSIKTKTNCTVEKGKNNFSEPLKKIAGITWTGKKGEKPVPHNPDGSIYINH